MAIRIPTQPDETPDQTAFRKALAKADVLNSPKFPTPSPYIISLFPDKDVLEKLGLVYRAYDMTKVGKYTVNKRGYRHRHPFTGLIPLYIDAVIGPEFVGAVVVSRLGPMPTFEPHMLVTNACQDAYAKVKGAIKFADAPMGQVGNLAFSYICDGEKNSYGWHEFCASNYQSKGVGRAMYEHALLGFSSTPTNRGKVSIIVADVCNGSKTSDDAKLIYPSLQRDYVGYGLTITNVLRNSPRGKKMMEYLSRSP